MELRFIPVLLLASTLGLVGCRADAPTEALAPAEDASLANGVTINEWTTVDRSILDPCAAEAVHIFGKAHVLVRESTAKDGTMKTFLHLNYAGVRGIGEVSELEYQVVAASREVFFASPSGAFDDELKETFQLVTRGNTDNYQSHFVAIFRIDEDGNVTQEIEERNRCVG
jgi:hypothetical protein